MENNYHIYFIAIASHEKKIYISSRRIVTLLLGSNEKPMLFPRGGGIRTEKARGKSLTESGIILKTF